MTMKKTVVLFEDHDRGSRRATVVGGFVRGGRSLLVVRPGYDAQGRRRESWTQVVDGDVPIWEFKRQAPLGDVLGHFSELWIKTFGKRSEALVEQALALTKQARSKAWLDGEAGVEPAPALTRDGRRDGLAYAA